MEIFQKSLIRPDFQDLLTRNQGFWKYLEKLYFRDTRKLQISQKSLICLEFRDLLTRNQGFCKYFENPSFLGYSGASTIPEIPKYGQISDNPDSTESLAPQKHFPRENSTPRSFSPRSLSYSGENLSGKSFCFQKGLACGKLPEIIDSFGIPRSANKKSRISRIFGKSFISGIPGNLKSPRNH